MTDPLPSKHEPSDISNVLEFSNLVVAKLLHAAHTHMRFRGEHGRTILFGPYSNSHGTNLSLLFFIMIKLCEEADATIRTNLLVQGLGVHRPVAYKATTIVFFVQSEFFFQLQVTWNSKMNSDCAETVGFQAALLLRISGRC